MGSAAGAGRGGAARKSVARKSAALVPLELDRRHVERLDHARFETARPVTDLIQHTLTGDTARDPMGQDQFIHRVDDIWSVHRTNHKFGALPHAFDANIDDHRVQFLADVSRPIREVIHVAASGIDGVLHTAQAHRGIVRLCSVIAVIVVLVEVGIKIKITKVFDLVTVVFHLVKVFFDVIFTGFDGHEVTPFGHSPNGEST